MRKFGLIGYPLGHSFSKKYFTEKFVKEHIEDVVYENFPIASIDYLPDLINDQPELSGLNVTIPYKEKVFKYLNSVHKIAADIGAVNTIKIDPVSKDLFGYNSDYYGFIESIKPALKKHHKQALILGTGGASKAVFKALTDLGVNAKYVSRNPENEDILSYKILHNDYIAEHQVIVNCSPLGTFPKTDQSPDIPYEFLSDKHLLYDLVYNPPKTKFLERGEEYGADTINGYQMLVLQAEKSWSIWNND